jgi:hypothetical protein
LTLVDEIEVNTIMESSCEDAEDIDASAQDDVSVTEDVTVDAESIESSEASAVVSEIAADEVDVTVVIDNENHTNTSITQEDVSDKVDDPLPTTTYVDDDDDAKEDDGEE